jgi:predicted metal-binding membrane protein
MSLQRERTLILTVLLILTAASWAILIWQSRTANTMGMGLTMGMAAALFLAIWVVMMIAMMFPAATPMILRGNESLKRPTEIKASLPFSVFSRTAILV